MLHARVALEGAVAQTDEPAAAEAQVVARLLQRLGRDRRESLVARVLEAGVQLELESVDEHLPDDRLAEVAGGGMSARAAAPGDGGTDGDN